MNPADVSALEQAHRFRIMRAAPLLGAHLHHTAVAPRRLRHPAPLTHKQRQRFLHINVFARRAGHDGLQGVPVVRR